MNAEMVTSENCYATLMRELRKMKYEYAKKRRKLQKSHRAARAKKYIQRTLCTINQRSTHSVSQNQKNFFDRRTPCDKTDLSCASYDDNLYSLCDTCDISSASDLSQNMPSRECLDSLAVEGDAHVVREGRNINSPVSLTEIYSSPLEGEPLVNETAITKGDNQKPLDCGWLSDIKSEKLKCDMGSENGFDAGSNIALDNIHACGMGDNAFSEGCDFGNVDNKLDEIGDKNPNENTSNSDDRSVYMDIFLRDDEIDFNCERSQRRSCRLTRKCFSQDNTKPRVSSGSLPVSPLLYASVKETLRKRMQTLKLSQGKNRKIFPQLPKVIIEQNLMNENFSEFFLPHEDYGEVIESKVNTALFNKHGVMSEVRGEGDRNDEKYAISATNNERIQENGLEYNLVETGSHKTFQDDKTNISQDDVHMRLNVSGECSSISSAATNCNAMSSSDASICPTHMTPMKPYSDLGFFDDKFMGFSPFPSTLLNRRDRTFEMPFITSTPIVENQSHGRIKGVKPDTTEHTGLMNSTNDGEITQQPCVHTCFQCNRDIIDLAAIPTHTAWPTKDYLFIRSKGTVTIWERNSEKWMHLHTWNNSIDLPLATHCLRSESDVSMFLNYPTSSFTSFTWDLTHRTADAPYTFTLPTLCLPECLCSVGGCQFVVASRAPPILTKYLLNTHRRRVDTQNTWHHELQPVTSLCSVQSVPNALLGLTQQFRLYIWNHEVGVLLKEIIVNSPSPDDIPMTLAGALDKRGLLLVLVMRRTETLGEHLIVAVNAMSGMSRIVGTLSSTSGSGKQCKGVMFANRAWLWNVHGNMMQYDLHTGNKTSHRNIVGFTAHEKTLYVAHSNRSVHAYHMA